MSAGSQHAEDSGSIVRGVIVGSVVSRAIRDVGQEAVGNEQGRVRGKAIGLIDRDLLDTAGRVAAARENLVGQVNQRVLDVKARGINQKGIATTNRRTMPRDISIRPEDAEPGAAK